MEQEWIENLARGFQDRQAKDSFALQLKQAERRLFEQASGDWWKSLVDEIQGAMKRFDSLLDPSLRVGLFQADGPEKIRLKTSCGAVYEIWIDQDKQAVSGRYTRIAETCPDRYSRHDGNAFHFPLRVQGRSLEMRRGTKPLPAEERVKALLTPLLSSL